MTRDHPGAPDNVGSSYQGICIRDHPVIMGITRDYPGLSGSVRDYSGIPERIRDHADIGSILICQRE